MHAQGTFEISMVPEAPYEDANGVTLGRARLEKRFSGPLTGTSVVHMLAARTRVEDSAGYVALERIVGAVEGREGSFVVVHTGLMNRGAQSLVITIVPDSGTGELETISGTMTITPRAGQHEYTLDYEL